MRADDKDELLVTINLSNHAVKGTVDLKNADSFTPLSITSLPDSASTPLPMVHLSGFAWRIFHRALK